MQSELKMVFSLKQLVWILFADKLQLMVSFNCPNSTSFLQKRWWLDHSMKQASVW
jgi:hypothetical protein